MTQRGYTAPVLTPAGAPPMYTTVPAAPVATQMATPQTQPIPTLSVQQPKEQPCWLLHSMKKKQNPGGFTHLDGIVIKKSLLEDFNGRIWAFDCKSIWANQNLF